LLGVGHLRTDRFRVGRAEYREAPSMRTHLVAEVVRRDAAVMPP
jgi:hypothetical protein